MRTHPVVLLATGALMLLAACGTSGESEPSEKSTTTVAAMSVEQWAAGFCEDFTGWLTEIETASTAVASEVTVGDYESAQTAVSKLFGTASQATSDLIAEIEAGGVPDLDDGQGLVDDLIDRFEGFVDAADQAQVEVEALELDPTTFEEEATALTERFSSEVEKVGESFDQIDADYPSPELAAALDESCNF